jgi:hypothetical protein
MAKADGDTTTWRMWLRQAVRWAGSLDVLLPPLRDGRVAAFHGGLRWLDGTIMADMNVGPAIPSDWWIDAKVYPDANRARFTVPITEHPGGRDTREVVAVEIEVEGAAVEALWPTPPSDAPAMAPKPLPDQRRKGGRKPEYDWDAIAAYCHRRFYDEGYPENVSAFCQDDVIPWCVKQFGEDGTPDIETFRPYVTRWAAAYVRSLPPK